MCSAVAACSLRCACCVVACRQILRGAVSRRSQACASGGREEETAAGRVALARATDALVACASAAIISAGAALLACREAEGFE